MISSPNTLAVREERGTLHHEERSLKGLLNVRKYIERIT